MSKTKKKENPQPTNLFKSKVDLNDLNRFLRILDESEKEIKERKCNSTYVSGSGRRFVPTFLFL